jgi:hypothetical protein
LTESAGLTDVLDGQACFSLPEETDDLFIGESRLLHVRHSLGLTDFVPFSWYSQQGAGQSVGDA